MFDWTLPVRTERYIYERLDLRLDRVGGLAGVRSCKLDWSIYNTIRGSGDLSIETPERIEWAHTIIRPWVVVTNRSGREQIPLMTAACVVPDEAWSSAGVQVSVQLYDLTMWLDQWVLPEPYSLTAGTVITSAIRAIFTSLGMAWLLDLTESDAVLASDRSWLPGEQDKVSWLRVINDLLDAAGYFAVWCSPTGRFQCQPYRRPEDRLSTWRLADDRASHRYRNLAIKRGRPVTYNRWEFWSRSVDGSTPVQHVAVNEDPDHPYSVPGLNGRVVTDYRTDVEGDVAAKVMAARAEAMADQSGFTLDARLLPVVEHEVVDLTHGPSGTATRASVAGRSLTCKPGAAVALTLRRVS